MGLGISHAKPCAPKKRAMSGIAPYQRKPRSDWTDSGTPAKLAGETISTGIIFVLDPKIFDDISKHVANSLPKGLNALQEDVQNNLHSALEAALGKMNLVTREEFDIQQAVLLRTREKLEVLSARIAELEKNRE